MLNKQLQISAVLCRIFSESGVLSSTSNSELNKNDDYTNESLNVKSCYSYTETNLSGETSEYDFSEENHNDNLTDKNGVPTLNGDTINSDEYTADEDNPPRQLNRNRENNDKMNLNIIFWNIRGISDKLTHNDLCNFLFNHDIIILTETHTDSASENLLNIIPGYIYKDFPRQYKHPNAPYNSGGIGIFVKSSIINGIKFECKNESLVWLKLCSSFFHWNKDKYIGCVYFSPNESTYIHTTNERTDYFNILSEEISARSERNDIFICGDFNARTGQLDDQPNQISGSNGPLETLCEDSSSYSTEILPKRMSKDTTINEYGKQLITLCKQADLRIMNGRIGDTASSGNFTCYKTNGGASLIDYLICRIDGIQFINNLICHPKRPESDHAALTFSIEAPVKHDENQPSHSNIAKFKWDKNRIQTYHENLQCHQSKNLLDVIATGAVDENTSVDEVCNMFYSYINYAVENTFKKTRSKTKSTFPRNLWFNEECKNIKRIVHNYAKTYDITVTPHAEQYTKLEKEYNRILQKNKRKYTDSIKTRLDNLNTSDPAQYWKLWKSLKPVTVNNSNLSLEDFEEYFLQQIKPPDVPTFDHNHMSEIQELVKKFDNETVKEINDPSYELCNNVITIDEIKIHLKKLKSNKAAGSDHIVGEFLKHGTDDIVNALYILYNKIFDDGTWPKSWAIGLISPVHKKESINKTDNYRKVTVMPVIGKVLESILNARLTFKNSVNNSEDPYQFGFKQDCQTQDNVFILYSTIMRQKFKNKPLYVCFVDFTKAFDYINRAALYYKLIKRGVSGKMLRLIQDMYNKASCRVKWKGEVGTKTIESEFGVIQGGMLSPKLFTEFLTDVKDYLNAENGVIIDKSLMSYILYADDMALVSDNAEGLQKLLDGLFSYCSKWHLIVSLAKTNIVIFGKHDAPKEFKFGSEKIKIADKYNYLGNILSNSKNIFNNNKINLIEKAQRATFSLNSYIQ